MNTSKPKKQYMLVIKIDTIEHVFTNALEVNEFLEDFKKKHDSYKSFDNAKQDTFYSNIKIENLPKSKLIIVRMDRYRKLERNKRPLVEIDTATSNLNEKELKEYFNVADNKNPIEVAYKSKNRILTIPTFFQNYSAFFSYESLTRILIQECLKDPFLVNIINIEKMFNDDPSMAQALENLFIAKNRFENAVKNSITNAEVTYPKSNFIKALKDFIKSWCYPKDKKGQRVFSHRRFRELASFVISHCPNSKEIKEDKTESSSKISKQEYFDREKIEQISFFDFSYQNKGGN